MHLLTIWFWIAFSRAAVAQLVKGDFGLITSDPICIQCADATVSWYGGVAPYVLSVSGYRNSYNLAGVGTTQSNQMKWHVNFPAGTRLWFKLVDANQTDIYTNIVTVATSADASCVNVTNSMVMDPTSTISSVSATSSSASTTALGSPDSIPGQHSPTSVIAGGVAGGVAALIVLVFLLGWFWRRNRSRVADSGQQASLDLDEDQYDFTAEPYTVPQTANGSRPSLKMKSLPSMGVFVTHPNSSNPGSSVAPTSSSIPGSFTHLVSNEAPSAESSRTPITSRGQARTENRPTEAMQEQDSGISLTHDLNTLPPAYDSSWRRT